MKDHPSHYNTAKGKSTFQPSCGPWMSLVSIHQMLALMMTNNPPSLGNEVHEQKLALSSTFSLLPEISHRERHADNLRESLFAGDRHAGKHKTLCKNLVQNLTVAS